jgi:hypothetical protein
MLMQEMAYSVRGFLTVPKDFLRVPVNGSLTVRADPDSGLFTGDLVLQQSTISRTALGVSLFSVTVQIAADSPVIGRIGRESQMFAAVSAERLLTPLCRCDPSPASTSGGAAAWSAGITGRHSPAADGLPRLSICWPLARGTPSSSISSRLHLE